MLDLYKVVGTSIPGSTTAVIQNNARLSVASTEFYPGAKPFNSDNGVNIIHLVTQDTEGLRFPYYDGTAIKQAYLPGVMNIPSSTSLIGNTNYTIVSNTAGTGIELIPWENSQPNLLPKGVNTFGFGYDPTPGVNIEGGSITYKDGYRLLNNKVVLGGCRTNGSGFVKDNRSYRMLSNLYNKVSYNLERENSSGSDRVITGNGTYIWDPNNNTIDTTNTVPTLELFLYEETFVELTKSINARVNSNGNIVLFANWNGSQGENRLGFETVPIFNTSSNLLNYSVNSKGYAPRGYNFVLNCIALQRFATTDPTATFSTLALGVKI